MNIAAANAGTPTSCRAGPMMTHEMMKLAVTGTASPSRITEIAEKMAVRSRLPPAKSTMMLASFRPRPVSVMTPTISPAAAMTGMTDSAPVAPVASASKMRRGVIQEARSRKLSTNARIVAYTTARNGVMPMAMNTTMAARELKW